jgi:hypothetical protein
MSQRSSQSKKEIQNQVWDKVPRWSKHPLLTNHTRCAALREIKCIGLPDVNASIEITV